MADRLEGYEPVQERISRFWDDHELGRISVELVEHDNQHVLARAKVWRVDTDEHPATEGWAQEVHDGSPVNRQGWMIENAETSAIGRALANLGYSPKGQRPTAEEMERVNERNRRQIADGNLATVTYDRLKLVKGTDVADELKALAQEQGHKLTLAELAGHPEWRALVDDVLDEHDNDHT